MRNGLFFKNDLLPSLFQPQWNRWDEMLSRPFLEPMRFVNAPADIEETDTHYLVTLEAPGFTKENIQVEAEEGILSISGERTRKKDDSERKAHVTERIYGRFQRRFQFGEDVDFGKIDAQFENGVLHITIPKKETKKSQRISVEVR